MSISITPHYLEHLDWKVESLFFLPSSSIDGEAKLADSCCLISHGYTASKNGIINWAIRLAEMGVPCLLFDWPGHYLGSFNECPSFEEFQEHAHELYQVAFFELEEKLETHFPKHLLKKLILAGHSMGALLALKALELEAFKELEDAEGNEIQKTAIAVGFGAAPEDKVHLFDTPFYKSTLLVREQLVSPELGYQKVFPWIKAEKENLNISNQKVFLLSGKDDVVVGENGISRFKELLEAKGNDVIVETPLKLAHHQPELAAPHIKKIFKDHHLL